MNESCPCNGCVAPKRHAGCHSTCPDYAKWNTEHQQELDKIRAIKAAENDYAGACLQIRLKKKRRRNVR